MDYKTINWKNGFVIGIVCCFFYFLYITADKALRTAARIRHAEDRILSALRFAQQIMNFKENAFFKK